MKINILAVGQRLPNWINEGVQTYVKRLQSICSLQLIEIPISKHNKSSHTQQAKIAEGSRLLKAIKPPHLIIALDEHGKQWNTLTLAKNLEQWQQAGLPLHFLIGGPDGLAAECLQKADAIWSLSPLTLAHGLARLVLIEQIYRAFSILHHHPYHRS